jgi:hypothetical protein
LRLCEVRARHLDASLVRKHRRPIGLARTGLDVRVRGLGDAARTHVAVGFDDCRVPLHLSFSRRPAVLLTQLEA